MENNTKLGANRTGIDMAPKLTQEMIEGSEKFFMEKGKANHSSQFFELKNDYLDDDEPLGSVPLPGTLKGAVKSTLKMATGHHPEVFINKLGQRLAFERSGVRIYEQLMIKCKHSAAQHPGRPVVPMERLEEFHRQEAEHFHLLVQCLEQLGADPTAQTPDADASGVATTGLMKVIMDPRTSLSQSLEAMLSIELADNAAWELLIKLAGDMGMPDMVTKFEHALKQENVHLLQVKQWYEESVRDQGKMSLT